MGVRRLAAVMVGVVLLAGVSATGALWAAWSQEAPSQEAEQDADAAIVTLLNPSAVERRVQLSLVTAAGGTIALSMHTVDAGSASTFSLAAAMEPTDYVATCIGCRGAPFAVAAGQRIVVFILSTGEAAAPRSDLHVVNESGRRQAGALRTGAVVGRGRTVLRFDLAPGESEAVGLRFAGDQRVDFNLACGACLPQLARAGNGVDLELVIR